MYSKYGNIHSGHYDSKKENKRANDLRFLEKAKEIYDLKEQVEFVLIPAQYINGKLVERACKYIADFAYFDKNGTYIVEDVKSPATRTKDYILKRKMMLYIHKIKINEI